MQTLLKPTLFMIARLGLFLAVVAWIVGQWQVIVMDGDSAMCLVRCEIRERGCTLDVSESFGSDGSDGSEIVVGMYYQNELPQLAQDPLCLNPEAYRDSVNSTGPYFGNYLVTWITIPGAAILFLEDSVEIGIHHWLVVALSVTLNIAIHFIYRKRPEVQPCES